MTILESEEKRDDGETPILEKQVSHLQQWNVVIPDDGELNHIVRFIPQENKKNLEVYIIADNKWKRIKIQWK